MAYRSQSPFTLSYEGADSFLGSRDSRKVRNNTYVQRRTTVHHHVVGTDATDIQHVAGPVQHSIAVMLHGTDVVTYEQNGRITINTGGYQTNTTKDRINGFAPCSISQKNYEWFVDGKPLKGRTLVVAGPKSKRRGHKAKSGAGFCPKCNALVSDQCGKCRDAQ